MGLFSSSKPVQPRQPQAGLFSRRHDPVTPRPSRRGGLFRSSKPVQPQPRKPRGGGLFSRRHKPAHAHPTPPTATATVGTTSRRHHPATTTAATKTKPKRGFGLFRRRERRHDPTMGEKVSGAVTRAKGTVTGDPVAQEVGARRMQGYEDPSVRRSRRF
ncbi:hypothetical protein ACRALDRAFT_2026183 [Sodiomyces alcalophilus JCM 7366]|uniref:uncharacterized protein n=1 Tax=Sodiomyces alcalophilus JCM 7366 TaxID=591952 RepID=UPI0039B3F12A